MVRKERPELEMQKNDLVVAVAAGKRKLVELEDTILRMLSSASVTLAPSLTLPLTLAPSPTLTLTLAPSPTLILTPSPTLTLTPTPTLALTPTLTRTLTLTWRAR